MKTKIKINFSSNKIQNLKNIHVYSNAVGKMSTNVYKSYKKIN